MIEHSYTRHLIRETVSLKEALARLNELAIDAILFVVDKDDVLKGSLTDGDVRRGLLKDLSLDSPVSDFIQPNPKFIKRGHYDVQDIIQFRTNFFRIVPVVDEQKRIINVINFRFFKSYLPIDAVIMAGGRGERLRPLTDSTPKPLLPIAGKPIIEYNIDRLSSYGIDDFWISVRYLGEQIEQHFGDGASRNIRTSYVWEKEALGTIGAVGTISDFSHDYVLVTNSDLLTNLDYEDFFLTFLESGADLSVVTIPYDVNIPYAVLETSNGHVMSFREKPTYTYYSNGGIYLLKKDVLSLIPKDSFYNATDLMEKLIAQGKKVHSYPLKGYWLDIGRHEDYAKAQEDIKHILF